MILIIGAGISGLSVANFLNTENYLILDQEVEPGGYCRTIKKDGFVWDYSGHFFHFRNDTVRDYLLQEMDKENLLTVEKRSQIYFKGEYVDFPFQKNIHQLPKEDLIDCLYDLFFRPDFVPSNFKEMLISKFGKSICEKFLFPYNEKLYACDLNTLDIDAMGRFFPFADLKEIIGNFKVQKNQSYNSTFTYHKDGAFEYVKSLLKRIDSEKISLDEKVIDIDVSKKLVKTNKRVLEYDVLVSSIPFDKLLKITGLQYNPDNYNFNKVLVYNLGFDKKGDPRNHWVYFPDKEFSFYRIGYYDNIFNDSRMSLYVEIGLQKEQTYNEQEILNVVLEDLRKAGVVTDQKLISYHSVLLDPAYVHITERSTKDVKEKISLLKKSDIHSIGRYGGWKYCSIEDNILEAKDLVEDLN